MRPLVVFINGEPFLKGDISLTYDVIWSALVPPHLRLCLTFVFMSAFWMVYPLTSQLPSSVGGAHSSAALKPHTSVTLTFRGAAGFSDLDFTATVTSSALVRV